MLDISSEGIPIPLSDIIIFINFSDKMNSTFTSSVENLQALSRRFFIAISSNPELPFIRRSLPFSGYCILGMILRS